MKKRKNIAAKVMAFLALFWIVISVIWTGLIIIFDNWNQNQEIQLTPEQLEELQELMNSQSWASSTWATASWAIEIK